MSSTSGSTNPYGLTSHELSWNSNFGRVPETATQEQQRLQTNLMTAQARANKLESLVGQGLTKEPSAPELDPKFQAGGKFALSSVEQQWAKGTPPCGSSNNHNTPLDQQLQQAQAKVSTIQQQLNSKSS